MKIIKLDNSGLSLINGKLWWAVNSGGSWCICCKWSVTVSHAHYSALHPWSPSPLSAALCKTPTLRLRNERSPLLQLLLPLVDDMSLPWGIQDEDSLFLPFIHAVLAPWCQACAHARSASHWSLLRAWERARGFCGCWRKTSLEWSGFRWLLSPFLYSEIPTTWSRKPTNNRARERHRVQARWNTHREKVYLPPFSTRDQPVAVFSAFWFLLAETNTLQLILRCPFIVPGRAPPCHLPSPHLFCVLPLDGSLLHSLPTDQLTVISQAESRSLYTQGVQLVHCLCLLSFSVPHLPPPPL